jgi:Integrase core domain
MGRTGSCLDNAVAESWFASRKVELVHRHHYRSRAEARAAIFRWIAWYNRFRLHATCGYLPPIEWEHQHAALSPHHRPRPHNPGVQLPGGIPARGLAVGGDWGSGSTLRLSVRDWTASGAAAAHAT